MGPDTGSLLEIAFGQLFAGGFFAFCAFLCDTGLGELGFEISNVGLLGLLLLFLHRAQVEFAIACGGGVVTFGVGIFGFLCFLLLGQTLEQFGDFVDFLVYLDSGLAHILRKFWLEFEYVPAEWLSAVSFST